MLFSLRLPLVWALLGSLTLGWLASHTLPSSVVEAQVTTPTVVPPGVNLIVNPSFEGDGYHPAEGNASGAVAGGWRNWYRLGPNAGQGDIRAPEWLPEDIWQQRSHMIRHGERSQKIFSTSATHDAGNWQVVTGLQPGQPVEFSVWVKVWTSDCGDPCYSPLAPCRLDSQNSNGNYDVAVGIDPFGVEPQIVGTPPASVVWSPWVRRYDQFFELRVRTIARSDRVTVYTRGTAEWRVQNNFSFWDDASLTVVDDTATPTAVATEYVAVTSTPTPSPTLAASPTATLTPLPTATRGPQVPQAFLPYIVNAGALAPTRTPTATTMPPTASPSPTATAVEVSPTATATLVPLVCQDVVTDGGFEATGAWQFEANLPYPASIVADTAHNGTHSLRLGPATTATEESFSYAWQAVTIPAGAERATLTYWLLVEGGDTNDTVDVELYTAEGIRVRRLLRGRPTTEGWQTFTADLNGWAGSTVQVWFNAYNDGAGATLKVHVDDVQIEACSRTTEAAKREPQPMERVLKPQAPRKLKVGAVNVHFTWVRYSPEQIFRSRICPECDIEWAYLVNDGDTVNLAGWTVTTERGDRYVFPSIELRHGDAVRLWTQVGTLAWTQLDDFGIWDVHWGSQTGLLANAHDNQTGRLTLVDPQGRQPTNSICWGPTQFDPGGCPTN